MDRNESNNMRHNTPLSKLVTHTVLKLFDDTELSAREIAKKVNKKYKHILERKLTRNSCLGIKHRAGKCIPNNRVYTYSKRNEYAYDKSVAFNEKKERITEYQKHQASKQRLIAALRR